MTDSFNIDDNSKILVIGDAILDKYLFGEVERISPEAPVPILKTKESEFRLGGAANVAASIAAMGTQVALLSLCGQDEESKSLKTSLIAANVKPILKSYKKEKTISKERIVSNNQQLLRIDDESIFSRQSANQLLEEFLNIYRSYDAVVLSDYGKGTLIKHQSFIKACNKLNIPILIDPKGGDFTKYKNSFLITPNLREFEEIVGPTSNEKNLIKKAKILKKQLNLTNLIITLGAKGVLLINEKQEEIKFSSEAKQVYDVSGAGDTVIAVLSALIAQKNGIQKSLRLANRAAGIAVGKFGTSVVTIEELTNKPSTQKAKESNLIDLKDLKKRVSELKQQGKIIVMTNGCFDILHAGHVDYLNKSKDLGDVLIVAINSDRSIKGLKGSSRPINKLEARSALLSSLKSVDFVVSFNASTPQNLYEQILPDVLVKGSDYHGKEIVGSSAVINNGGKIELIEYLEGYSTSKIIEKILSTS